MIIRKAKVSDLDKIVEFNLNLAMETENKKLNADILSKGVRKILDGHIRAEYFVCEINGIVVGQMMIVFEWSDWRNGEFIWIQSVYVDRDYRKMGVFKKLFDNVKSYLESNESFIGMRLYVEKNNRTAKMVYESMGMYENEYNMYEYIK